MRDVLPPELVALFEPDSTPAAVEAAWSGFTRRYTDLLLRTARSLGGDADVEMDRYTWILDRLRENDYRRLRAFVADGRSSLQTWLAVVARRLCYDYDRHRHGRVRGSGEDRSRSRERRADRRRLLDLIGADVDLATIADSAIQDPERDWRLEERDGALREALAALTPEDRLLLRLRVEDGMSARRVADFVGLPTPFHVYRRVDAILRRLRDDLGQRGVDGPAP